jgi:hypothetical protein
VEWVLVALVRWTDRVLATVVVAEIDVVLTGAGAVADVVAAVLDELPPQPPRPSAIMASAVAPRRRSVITAGR